MIVERANVDHLLLAMGQPIHVIVASVSVDQMQSAVAQRLFAVVEIALHVSINRYRPGSVKHRLVKKYFLHVTCLIFVQNPFHSNH